MVVVFHWTDELIAEIDDYHITDVVKLERNNIPKSSEWLYIKTGEIRDENIPLLTHYAYK